MDTKAKSRAIDGPWTGDPAHCAENFMEIASPTIRAARRWRCIAGPWEGPSMARRPAAMIPRQHSTTNRKGNVFNLALTQARRACKGAMSGAKEAHR
ncbi:MAG: hypothetical protein AAGA87_15280 [Pseudomonadota bacterium]